MSDHRNYVDALRAMGHDPTSMDLADYIWVCTGFPACPCRSWLEAEPSGPHDCCEGNPFAVKIGRDEL